MGELNEEWSKIWGECYENGLEEPNLKVSGLADILVMSATYIRSSSFIVIIFNWVASSTDVNFTI